MIRIPNSQCTACGACVQVCPKQSLSMKQDDSGFLYPNVDNTCVNCGLCETVCPIDKTYNGVVQSTYAVISTDKEILLKSSSGGVFGTIAAHVIGKGGVVYGCAFTDGFKSRHIRVDRMEHLHKIQGSKYVQSDTGVTYKQVKADLKKNLRVFYCGTPCQIDGLRNFLGQDYDNLLTADLICHGVPSQAYFDKYFDWLEQRIGGRIKELSFRDKSAKGWSCIGSIFYEKHGKQHRKVLYPSANYYYYYFLKGYIYRDSCYTCKYANVNRVADFTLGDFWGVEKYLPKLNVNETGCSLVLVNTMKAERIFNELKIRFFELEMSQAVAENEQLKRPSHRGIERDILIREFMEVDSVTIARRFVLNFKSALIKAYISAILPYRVKYFLKRTFHKFQKRGTGIDDSRKASRRSR